MREPSENPEKVQSRFVKMEVAGPVLTASIVGPSIGEREASIIQTEIAAAMEQHAGFRHLVLDMTSIEFMPSRGIGMCISMHNGAKAKGASSYVLGLNDDLSKMFKMMNLHKLFKVVKDREALGKALR